MAKVSRFKLILGLSCLNLIAFKGATMSRASLTWLNRNSTALLRSSVLYSGDQSIDCRTSSRSHAANLEISL